MSERDEKKFRKLLGAMCEHCSDEDGYCILKEIMVANGTSERFLIQLKNVEIFKMDESRRQNRDIGWKIAWDLWVEKGYAAKFAEVYDSNPELDYKTVYEKVIA